MTDQYDVARYIGDEPTRVRERDEAMIAILRDFIGGLGYRRSAPEHVECAYCQSRWYSGTREHHSRECPVGRAMQVLDDIAGEQHLADYLAEMRAEAERDDE